MENTVETMITEPVRDDAALAVQEDGQESAQGFTELAEALSQASGEAAKAQGGTEEQKPVEGRALRARNEPTGKSEPGWIKRRIEEGVRKEAAAMEARLRAEYEEKLAPLRETAIAREADALVAEGEFKSRERAIEYLRLKNGFPARNAEEGQPHAVQRDEKGRFSAGSADESARETPEVQQRAASLFAQAQTIQALSGVDVMELYNTHPDVKRRILSGEWDFMDVFRTRQDTAPSVAPAPVRSANGAAFSGISIARMSPEQFSRLDELLAQGGRIDMRK